MKKARDETTPSPSKESPTSAAGTQPRGAQGRIVRQLAPSRKAARVLSWFGGEFVEIPHLISSSRLMVLLCGSQPRVRGGGCNVSNRSWLLQQTVLVKILQMVGRGASQIWDRKSRARDQPSRIDPNSTLSSLREECSNYLTRNYFLDATDSHVKLVLG